MYGDLQTFNHSYWRVVMAPEDGWSFFERVCEDFMANLKKIKTAFHVSDPEALKRALVHCTIRFPIYYSFTWLGHDPWIEKLRLTIERHSGSTIGQVIELWMESLLKILKALDPKFTDDEAAAWREIMRPGVELIRKSKFAARPWGGWTVPAEGAWSWEGNA